VASEAKKPRASKMLPRTMEVGLFSAALFIGPTLGFASSLSQDFRELLAGCCGLPPLPR
jgi:hypothetical protein